MRIVSIRHGRIPKIRMLHHRFREDSLHLMVTLDVEDYTPSCCQSFFSMYHSLTRVFPTLARHKCCEQWENTPLFLQETAGVSVKTVGEIADIAHLTEHMIVDVVVSVTAMPTCSGITCGHQHPENRFDLFIECEDLRVGVFAANFASYLVWHLFTRPRLSRRYARVVRAANWLYMHPGDGDPCVRLIAELGYSPGMARMCANLLRIFQFFEYGGR